MKVTFGEWLRWTFARRKVTPAQLAVMLDVSRATITNLFQRATPGRTSDETISALASILGMSEPEVLSKWKDGLPRVSPVASATKSKRRRPAKAKRQVNA